MLINCKTILFSSIEDIVYIKSEKEYLRIYNPTPTDCILGALCKTEKDLPEYFIKAHRSYIINIKKIQEIKFIDRRKYRALMCNGDEIPLTADAYKQIMTLYV